MQFNALQRQLATSPSTSPAQSEQLRAALNLFILTGSFYAHLHAGWEAAPEESSPMGSRAGGWGCREHSGRCATAQGSPPHPPEQHQKSCNAPCCPRNPPCNHPCCPGMWCSSNVPSPQPAVLGGPQPILFTPCTASTELSQSSKTWGWILLSVGQVHHFSGCAPICNEIKERKESAQSPEGKLCWAEQAHGCRGRAGRIRNQCSSTQHFNADCISMYCI